MKVREQHMPEASIQHSTCSIWAASTTQYLQHLGCIHLTPHRPRKDWHKQSYSAVLVSLTQGQCRGEPARTSQHGAHLFKVLSTRSRSPSPEHALDDVIFEEGELQAGQQTEGTTTQLLMLNDSCQRPVINSRMSRVII
eukprot:1160450-Pelagomonas_calceolata.AAC.22